MSENRHGEYGAHIPDSIKIHKENTVKVVPNKNKSHSGDSSNCRIVPGEPTLSMENELNYTSIPLDSGERIKIVPSSKK